MYINFKKNNKNQGYAILFAVVVVGIISMITIGLSNSAYKQTILSSVAKDSTIAFYQADIGSECALYAEKILLFEANQTKTYFDCADHRLNFSNPIPNYYTLTPENETSTSKCFYIEVTKTIDASSNSVETKTRGYNICNKNSLRTVERGLKVNY